MIACLATDEEPEFLTFNYQTSTWINIETVECIYVSVRMHRQQAS
jgi:hypothetical protein